VTQENFCGKELRWTTGAIKYAQCRNWGYHTGGYQGFHLLGYNATQSVASGLTSRRSMYSYNLMSHSHVPMGLPQDNSVLTHCLLVPCACANPSFYCPKNFTKLHNLFLVPSTKWYINFIYYFTKHVSASYGHHQVKYLHSLSTLLFSLTLTNVYTGGGLPMLMPTHKTIRKTLKY
jgi:hypothetical protein